MNLVNDDIPDVNSSSDSILLELLHQLKNLPPDRIELNCFLEKYLSAPEKIKDLFPLPGRGIDESISLIFPSIKLFITNQTDPWKYIEQLLSVKEEKIIHKTLGMIKNLVYDKILDMDTRIIKFFADRYEIENSILSSPEMLEKIATTFKSIPVHAAEESDLLTEIYLNHQDIKCRIFAARLLDIEGSPASGKVIEKILGRENSEVLSSYFTYTRISYLDLLYLIPEAGEFSPAVKSLLECRKICSENILREVIANAGWKSLNYGLEVKHYIGVNIDGSLPLFMYDSEAAFLENTVHARRVSEFYLFTAHGGLPFETNESYDDNKPVALFRSYNLAHANLLREILDIAPLSSQKIRNIIEQLDRIVSDFVILFNKYSEECEIIPGIYNKIRDKVLKELNNDPSAEQISADTTRLVQMFEDPHNIGEIHTLHGLKRYLHQKGLQLGFKLVDQSKSPNRNITLVLASNTKVLNIIKRINYAEFEQSAAGKYSDTNIPYPVKAAIDGFERQILYGLESFPSLNIFCYGNEIHYFVWFRNHPVFVRIDFSPPLQGGMIDLQYFGVSNYELADHPNINLDSIRYFFEFLDFDVEMSGTHIHARYDKERALNLNQLCERAEYLFCLVPYLMDLDWIIGSLDLPDDAKKKVTKAWAELFVRWGAIPYKKLLTKNKLGILQQILNSPEGEFEIAWNGEDKYQDWNSVDIKPGFFDNIYDSFKKLDLNISPNINSGQPGQIYLEKNVLNPLREALKESLIIETPQGFKRSPEDQVYRIHEAVLFSELLNVKSEDYNSSITLAKIIMPVEQTLKFKSTGTLESFKIQTSTLPLGGDNLKLFVLRDYNNILRMAFYTHSSILLQKKENGQWKSNARFCANELMSILRENNYTVSGFESPAVLKEEDIEIIQDEFKIHKDTAVKMHPGEKALSGLRASPGRVTGRVLFGAAGRMPEDFNEHIFMASSVSPDDNTTIYHCAGIIATGGGILSHAGLIATQFNKPAIIITGEWIHKPNGSVSLLFHTSEYKIERKFINNFNINLFYDLHELHYELDEGDLVVLDADEGIVYVLGQERNTIALYEGLKSFGRINEIICGITNPGEMLVFRGKKLHILHQVEKLLLRITDPVLAKFAVHEILTGKFLEGGKSTTAEKAYLLNLLFKNKIIGDVAGQYLQEIAAEIQNRFNEVYLRAIKDIPSAKYPFEVVMPRFQVMQIFDIMRTVASFDLLSEKIQTGTKEVEETDNICILRLEYLFENISEKVKKLNYPEEREYLRHLFRQFNRISKLLNSPEIPLIKKMQSEFERNDKLNIRKFSNKFIIKPGTGAHDLVTMTGWKAANLSELEMLGGRGLVPAWFVITDRAFQHTLNTVIKDNLSIPGGNIKSGITLKQAIERILERDDISNRDKSLHIKNLWDKVQLSEEIKKDITESYNEIRKNSEQGELNNFYVALRSSTCEEDAEISARAGEFETYLFINGEESLIEYTKRTWGGLWTDRAIHNRSVLGNQKIYNGGGIIVQQMVWSRISGVLQTINVAKGDLKEIVINAGLGLGEGIVSGAVAADQIIVKKEGDLIKGPLHFNYI
ncbi:MAG: hypothetical protein EHM47_16580, partial [Ignavibacteriales bacterium]